MESSDPLTFRAYISPRSGNRFLVTVISPLLAAPLYRSYPEAMGADAAVERAVGHAVAIVTAMQSAPVQVRVTWQAVLGWKPHKQKARDEELHLRLSPCCQKGTVKD